MGIFNRIKEIVSADTNHWLDQFEDPASMAKHYIRQIEEHIYKAHQSLANQLAAEQRYNMLIAAAEQVIAKRSRQAELAVDRGEDGIAELALEDKLHHRQLLSRYVEQREFVRQQAETLKSEIERLAGLHQELQTKLSFLAARADAAKTLESTACAASGFETDRLTRSFARMEEKVWRLEAGAASRRSPAANRLESLQRLDRRDEIQAELAQLKASREN